MNEAELATVRARAAAAQADLLAAEAAFAVAPPKTRDSLRAELEKAVADLKVLEKPGQDAAYANRLCRNADNKPHDERDPEKVTQLQGALTDAREKLAAHTTAVEASGASLAEAVGAAAQLVLDLRGALERLPPARPADDITADKEG